MSHMPLTTVSEAHKNEHSTNHVVSWRPWKVIWSIMADTGKT